MADELLVPEDIVPYLKAKYPHLYKGNDEVWCRMREDALLSLLKSYDAELLLDAQLAKAKPIVEKQERERIFDWLEELLFEHRYEDSIPKQDIVKGMQILKERK